MKTIKKEFADNPLQECVRRWINSMTRDGYESVEDVLNDLIQGGCQSGIVGSLIYYTDTVKFFKKYLPYINELLKETIDSTGLSPQELFGDKFDPDDPLVQDTFNQNLLAWFGFEESAQILADKVGIEIQ